MAAAVYLARTGADRDAIRERVGDAFGYDLDRRLDALRHGYGFEVSCQGSVPEAILAFLDSTGVEDAVRNAISLGGDADTQACIAGAIAEPFYGGVPEALAAQVRRRLDPALRSVLDAFTERYVRPRMPTREP